MKVVVPGFYTGMPTLKYHFYLSYNKIKYTFILTWNASVWGFSRALASTTPSPSHRQRMHHPPLTSDAPSLPPPHTTSNAPSPSPLLRVYRPLLLLLPCSPSPKSWHDMQKCVPWCAKEARLKVHLRKLKLGHFCQLPIYNTAAVIQTLLARLLCSWVCHQTWETPRCLWQLLWKNLQQSRHRHQWKERCPHVECTPAQQYRAKPYPLLVNQGDWRAP